MKHNTLSDGLRVQLTVTACDSKLISSVGESKAAFVLSCFSWPVKTFGNS